MSDLFAEAQEPPKKTRGKKAAAEPAAEAPTSVEESVGALVTTTVANPVAVFTDGKQFSQFYDKLKAETEKHVPDLTTDKGRRAVASLAFRVTKAKTTLVAAGKTLTEDWRKQIALVNASRNTMEAELDQLAAEVRRPLTEWEEAEAARRKANAETIAQMRADAVVQEEDTSATVEARGRAIFVMTFEAPQWTEEEAEAAETEKAQAVHLLATARQRLAREELERAELEELRKEKAERERLAEEERVAKEAREAAEAETAAAKAREEEAARLAEEARLAAEKAEAERIETARREAAEAAAAEAEKAAQAERDRIQAEHDAQIAAERAERDRIEQAAKAEAERIAEEARQEQARRDAAHEAALQAERDAAAKAAQEREEERRREAEAEAERRRVAAEAEAAAEAARQRSADQEHRRKIKTAIKEAIMAAGPVEEDVAVKVVQAIVAGDVPHLTVGF